MMPAEAGPDLIFLRPGELLIIQKPAVVQTVLGSCISVTMFNRRLGIAAICHAQLPKSGTKGQCNTNCPVVCGMKNSQKGTFKYADCAICFMHKKFQELGIKPGEIVVKLFGGADVLRNAGLRAGLTIGRQNIEISLKVIEDERLVLSASSTGGKRGRKIYFHTQTGEVLQKYIKKGDVLTGYDPRGKTLKQRGLSFSYE